MTRSLALLGSALFLATLVTGCEEEFSDMDSALYSRVMEAIPAELGTHAAVRCPDPPRSGRPGTYACTAVADGDTTSWIATVTQDADGKDNLDVVPSR